MTLADAWLAEWPAALEVWSKYTRLSPPRLCASDEAAQAEGLRGSFAMIRLVDQTIVVNLAEIARAGLGDYAREILAHEIGHHVLAPATLADDGRMIARMRHALPTLESRAPLLANLYTDLLINDRLQRSAELRIADVYRALSRPGQGGRVWALYLRIYEILWRLPRGELGGGAIDDRTEGDAWLGSRLVRSYARDWLAGSGRFAALFLPHLLADAGGDDVIEKLLDMRDAGQGGEPVGLTELDPDELSGAIHPAQDPELTGDPAPLPAAQAEDSGARPGRGQAREPFEYGELLRALGIALSDHDAAVRYYRERALPHLVPFPRRRTPQSQEPQLEGLLPWDIGAPLDALDLLQSVQISPRVIPGLTTVQRSYGTMQGELPEREPLDLDLYVDSSGSMPNPQHRLSFPTLAGAIVCLSALRAGARVQATLWSGKQQFQSTQGFVRDETAILRVLTGFFGGGTAFPIHVLRETYARRRAGARPAHILVISDDGVSTMFDPDERGQSGADVAARALAAAGGGGTLVLDLAPGWDRPGGGHAAHASIVRARDELGFVVERIASWEELVGFARAFSRRTYEVA